MFTAWPAQYGKHYGGSDNEKRRNAAKRMWATSAEFQALTADQVSTGIRRMVDQCEYLPSLKQFLKMAERRPEDFGLPSVAEAWLEANNTRHLVMQGMACIWSHGAIPLAAKGLWHRMGMADEIGIKLVREEFERAYQAQVNRVVSGQDINPDLMQIEDRSSYAERQLIQSKIEIEQQMEKQGITADPAAARQALLSGLARGAVSKKPAAIHREDPVNPMADNDLWKKKQDILQKMAVQILGEEYRNDSRRNERQS